MARPEIVQRIAARLLHELAAGTWSAEGLLPPARQLRTEFGAALRTVLLAVRRLADQGLLTLHQRQRVRIRPGAARRARQLLAARPARAAPRQVAILLPQEYLPAARNDFYYALTRAISQQAARQGWRATLVPWPEREQIAFVGSLLCAPYEAAVLVGVTRNYLASLLLLHRHKFPFVVFNQRWPDLPLATVVTDLYRASWNIAEHLHALGHRNLCLVAHPRSYQETAGTTTAHWGKACGWLHCLEHHGLLANCLMPIYLPWEPTLGLYNRTFRAIMDRPDRPTALVFGHSPWARAFLLDPAFRRFRIPEELSLATFETMERLPQKVAGPPLTTIEINHTRTAQCILELLARKMDRQPESPTIRVSLDMALTASIGPPNGLAAPP